MLYTGMFTVEPSTFRYTFAGDESFHVLDGESGHRGRRRRNVTLQPDTLPRSRKVLTSTWTVRRTLRKFFVISG